MFFMILSVIEPNRPVLFIPGMGGIFFIFVFIVCLSLS